MTSINTIKIHHYLLHDKIGKGGFANVYKAQYKNTNKMVALKIIQNKNQHSIAISLMKHESKILAYLNKEIHLPCIPTMFWYGKFGNLMCMATTLYTTSFYDGIANITNKLKVCCDILNVFKHIHTASVIHCDVKPDNFMFDEYGNIALIDFGLARCFVNSNNIHVPNSVSGLNGTPKYLSQHVLLGNRPSRRDDLISVGYILSIIFQLDLPWLHQGYDENKRLDEKMPDKLLNSVSHCPSLFNYFKYVFTLDYDSKPDFMLLLACFSS